MVSDNDMVRAFQEKFGIPIRKQPQQLDAVEHGYRVKFMKEELQEFVDAYVVNDLVGQADALVDLAYVVHGTALMMGLPWSQLFLAVHHCNMRKVSSKEYQPPCRACNGVGCAECNGTGKRIPRHTYDVVKPPGWSGPELELQRILLAVANDDG